MREEEEEDKELQVQVDGDEELGGGGGGWWRTSIWRKWGQEGGGLSVVAKRAI